MKNLKKKIELWWMKKVMQWFFKYWSYGYDFLGSDRTWHIVMCSEAGFKSIDIPKSKRTDRTHELGDPDLYHYTSARLDAAWTLKEVRLHTSRRDVDIFIVPREKREYYLKEFKRIKEDKSQMEIVNIDMTCAMDLDVKVIGDGRGLNWLERKEIGKILKNFNFEG